jgi:hypothetical protein
MASTVAQSSSRAAQRTQTGPAGATPPTSPGKSRPFRRARPTREQAYSSWPRGSGRLGGGVMQTKFKIGEVIAVGLRIWAHNLLPFAVLTAVMDSPMIVWGAITAQRHIIYGSAEYRSLVMYEGVSLLTLPLRATVLSALLTYGVVMELQGRRVSIYACIATGLSRLISAFGTMVVGCVCLGLAYFAGAVPGVAISPWFSTVTGGLAALYVAARYYVAPQAAVVDHTGMVESLGRSRDLTKGHRLALVALLLALFAIAFGARFAIARIAWNLAALTYLDLAVMIAIGSIIATMPSVAYYYLRAEKEGSSAEELATVFD